MKHEKAVMKARGKLLKQMEVAEKLRMENIRLRSTSVDKKSSIEAPKQMQDELDAAADLRRTLDRTLLDL